MTPPNPSLPLVSAIITTHNRLTLLPRAIESVVGQTYPRVECIVVDDASTDGTEAYCTARSDIRYVRIAPGQSRGGNHARNVGIEAARGELVALLDDDDCWMPTKIELQVPLMRSDCALVHCGRRLEFVQPDGSVRCEDELPSRETQGDLRRTILYRIATVTSCIMVRRQLLLDVGGFDEALHYWQEYELSIRLAQRGPFAFVAQPLTLYRYDQQDGNRLTNRVEAWRESVRYIYAKHRTLYAQLTPSERRQVCILRWRDASSRCRAAGLRWRARAYSLGLLVLRPWRTLRLFAQAHLPRLSRADAPD